MESTSENGPVTPGVALIKLLGLVVIDPIVVFHLRADLN